MIIKLSSHRKAKGSSKEKKETATTSTVFPNIKSPTIVNELKSKANADILLVTFGSKLPSIKQGNSPFAVMALA